MIDPVKPMRLRNGFAVRDIKFTNCCPYAIQGSARLDGGVWERAEWTRDGSFSIGFPDPAYPDGHPYDLVNVDRTL